ncbi:hypothetical protein ACI2IP_10320 [Microbacterium sp. NPDC090218]
MADQNPSPQESRSRMGLGIGLALGMAIGASLGAALQNWALGIGIGLAIGVALSVAITSGGSRRRAEGEDEGSADPRDGARGADGDEGAPER